MNEYIRNLADNMIGKYNLIDGHNSRNYRHALDCAYSRLLNWEIVCWTPETLGKVFCSFPPGDRHLDFQLLFQSEDILTWSPGVFSSTDQYLRKMVALGLACVALARMEQRKLATFEYPEPSFR